MFCTRAFVRFCVCVCVFSVCLCLFCKHVFVKNDMQKNRHKTNYNSCICSGTPDSIIIIFFVYFPQLNRFINFFSALFDFNLQSKFTICLLKKQSTERCIYLRKYEIHVPKITLSY